MQGYASTCKKVGKGSRMVVWVWCGNGNPSVARFGVCVLRRDREAEARDRWRCRARNVEMLRARLWWAQRWGFSRHQVR